MARPHHLHRARHRERDGRSELLEQILAAPVVRCDEIAWSFLGLSMAAWNAIACARRSHALWLRAYASSSTSQYR